MLDASKAFDRVNFWLLFNLLLSRNVPLFIVRIRTMWYTYKRCASDGAMQFLNRLLFPMV